MKDSSIAILAALAVSGAAGVYLATRDASDDLVADPRAEKVADPSAQRADPYAGGSSGADSGEDGYITKGELCAQIRADIPEAQKRLNEEQAKLDAYLDSPIENAGENPNWAARNYRLQTYSRRNNAKKEQDAYRYMVEGDPLDEPIGDKKPEPWLVAAMERIKAKVEAHRTRIDTLKRSLAKLEADELDLIKQGVCY